ncbi:PIN domain-containing protein [Granulicella tundricola]|uniref:PIN domain protein n=1 Tax=Granulicella tundricola (strain ATCC BAA-1859 / DSM 23138 / MP5ACTX9) TaxID=1198114 RepID=E8WYK7_GRATM|nr:PIN domain-containing protein [Granulicella tundricola]ADW67605.1 PIN domain protein [Granulicella tundricola MP5ACTX9]
MNSTTETSISVDTNILFYSFDPRDVSKHEIAKRIMSFCLERKAQIALQVLAEFHHASVRKNVVSPLQADAIVQDFMQRMPVIATTPGDLATALDLRQRHGLQIFDCLILAVNNRSGCASFLSEDLQHNRKIGQITVLNPFLLTPSELDALLA